MATLQAAAELGGLAGRSVRRIGHGRPDRVPTFRTEGCEAGPECGQLPSRNGAGVNGGEGSDRALAKAATKRKVQNTGRGSARRAADPERGHSARARGDG